jgi:N-acetylneuraminic acid mutarotase
MRSSTNIHNQPRHYVVPILALVGSISAVLMTGLPTKRVSAQATASWSYTGNLNTGRGDHTATLLPNGKVLVTGGYRNGSLNSAEIYDPTSSVWIITGNLNTARELHTATLLQNGKVLVAGGINNSIPGYNPLNSVELYDPSAGSWSSIGNLNTARYGHTATLLKNGKLLVAGGFSCSDGPFGRGCFLLNSAELYDPATETFSVTGSLSTTPYLSTATLLPNGKVLVAGGQLFQCGSIVCIQIPNNHAELYDPATATWSTTGNLNTARYYHSATLLPNGKVLVAGFYDDNAQTVSNSAELYDPATGVWSNTGNLIEGLGAQTAALLPNGKVLIAGGFAADGNPSRAELYDPVTGIWSMTASPNSLRYGHTLTLLVTGKVLVAGGFDDNTAEQYDPGASETPGPTPTSTPTPTPSPTATPTPTPTATPIPGPASWATPTNLGSGINSSSSDQQPAISPDGLSLYFASDRTSGSLGGFDMYVSQRASVNDPWGAAVNVGPSLNTASDEGNPAFSRDGRLLFFQSKRPGGSGGIDIWLAQRNNPQDNFAWQPAVNLGSAVNSTVDETGPCYFEDIARGTRQLYFGSARPGLGGTDIYVSEQIANGSFGPAALVAELSSTANETRPSIRHDGLEIYFQSNRAGGSGLADLWVAMRGSTADAWSTPVNLATTVNTPSVEQNPYLSSDGSMLFFASDRPGGSGGLDIYMSTRSLPPPSWTITGNLKAGRDSQTATLLPNGKVLVVGGNNSDGTLKSAELYDPVTGTWSFTSNLNTSRAFHTATLLANGKVLVAGGFGCAPPPATCSYLNSAELYDSATGTWSNTGNLNSERESHTATALPNGKVLVVGGDNVHGALNSAELYDPATETWTVNLLNVARYLHAATLLQNGKVLVAGGVNYFAVADDGETLPIDSAELYDPATGMWTLTGNLNTARERHTMSLLPNGKVLAAAGFLNFNNGQSTGQVTNTAELYDPATGTWSNTGNLNTGRAYHTVTLLPNGNALIVGGFNMVNGFPNITDSAELYDPATGKWNNTASLNIPRRFHTATLLQNGKVLAVGGNGFSAPTSAELYYPGKSGPNQIDDARFFVRQHYLDFLNREPDAAGLAFWTNEITSCGSDAQCVEVKRINDSGAFFLSIEFQQSGYLVYRIYKSSFGNLPNSPVPIRLSEFLPDAQQIGQGVIVGQAGWETALENNKQTFISQFVQRSRFASAYPTSLSPAQFVDALFANAAVVPSSGDRTAAINEFGAASTTTDVAARARVLRRVAENSTLQQQEFNRAFVLMQYFGYFRRNPNDAPDGNFAGYDFWLNKLNQFNGNYLQAEMVKAFISATEYRHRFGP